MELGNALSHHQVLTTGLVIVPTSLCVSGVGRVGSLVHNQSNSVSIERIYAKENTTMPTGWGYYLQGSDQQIEEYELGSKLSEVLHCPVHYPAWAKPLYECKCGVLFPKFAVTIANRTGDWSNIHIQHLHGFRPSDASMLSNGHALNHNL